MAIYTGTQTVTTAGTRVALTAVRTAASWLIVTGRPANVGNIFVGGADVTSTNGIPVAAGGSFSFPDVGGPTYLDLKDIYIDAANNGDQVIYIYGRR